MNGEYDPHATTNRLRAMSHEDAQALERLTELRRREAARIARKELAYTIGLCAQGFLAALGIWKLFDLVRYFHAMGG